MQETLGLLGSIPGSGRSPGEGIGYPLQYSWASPVAQMVKNPSAMQETWVLSLGWEDPLEKGLATHSSILCLKNPHGQRSLEGHSSWGRKESDTAEWLSPAQRTHIWASLVAHGWRVQLPMQEMAWSLDREDPLEKEMATHSSILAWRIHPMDGRACLATVHGVTRVRHGLVTKQQQHSHIVRVTDSFNKDGFISKNWLPKHVHKMVWDIY